MNGLQVAMFRARITPQPAPKPAPITELMGKKAETPGELVMLLQRIQKLEERVLRLEPGPTNEPPLPSLELKLPPPVRAPTAAAIISAVAEHYGISSMEVRGAQRGRRYTIPRHIAMYLAAKLTGLSLPAIGRCLGDRDHTTVMHGRDRISTAVDKSDPDVTAAINEIMAKLA